MVDSNDFAFRIFPQDFYSATVIADYQSIGYLGTYITIALYEIFVLNKYPAADNPFGTG